MAQRRNQYGQGQGTAQPTRARDHARNFVATTLSGVSTWIATDPAITGQSATNRGRSNQPSSRRGSQQQHSNSQGFQGQRQTDGQSQGTTQQYWGIPAEYQQPFPFNQGDLAHIHNSLPKVDARMPGAPIAILHILHSYLPDRTDETREYELERAAGRFHQLKRMNHPTDDSLLTAEIIRTEKQSSPNELDRLTGELGFLEEHYLRRVTGERTDISLQELNNSLASLADRLQAQGSTGRQASARAMLADVCLMMGYISQKKHRRNYQAFYDASTSQMAKALELLGQKYQDRELDTIAQAAQFVNGSSYTQSSPERFAQSAGGFSNPPMAKPVGASHSQQEGPPPGNLMG